MWLEIPSMAAGANVRWRSREGGNLDAVNDIEQKQADGWMGNSMCCSSSTCCWVGQLLDGSVPGSSSKVSSDCGLISPPSKHAGTVPTPRPVPDHRIHRHPGRGGLITSAPARRPRWSRQPVHPQSLSCRLQTDGDSCTNNVHHSLLAFLFEAAFRAGGWVRGSRAWGAVVAPCNATAGRPGRKLARTIAQSARLTGPGPTRSFSSAWRANGAAAGGRAQQAQQLPPGSFPSPLRRAAPRQGTHSSEIR